MPVKMTKIKQSDNTQCLQGPGEIGFSLAFLVGVYGTCHNQFGNGFGSFLDKSTCKCHMTQGFSPVK